MQIKEPNPTLRLGPVRRRPIAALLLVLLWTGALVVLVGTIAGSSPALAQDMASGQSSPDLSAPADPISGTFQVVLPLVYRDWQPGPPEIAYLAADPPIVAPGQSTTLSWGVNNEVFGLTLLPGGTNVTGRGSLEVWPAETTVYRLVATNALGSDSAEVTVTVQPLPEITLFMANPDTIDVGGQSLLMWRVSESVTRLVLEPEAGEVTGQASATVWPTHTTVYTLTAYNAAGSTTAQVTVTVNPPTIYWFRADPATVDQGTPSTLSWSVSQPVDSLTIEPGVGEVTGLSSVQVAPAQTTVYTLTAANSAGSDTERVTVTVSGTPPDISGFAANPAAINAGESSTLSWTVAGEVDSLAIDQGVGDVTGLGSKVVSPAATTTYRLTATNAWGSDTADVTVTVTGGGDPWWHARWRARALIEAQGSGYDRFARVIETAINFTTKLADAGLSGTFDEANLRVVEVDADGGLLNAQVTFQFDRGAGYNAAANAAGTLVILMDGQTAAAQTRRFYAYFDTTANQDGKTPADVPAQVTLQDNVMWAGQNSFKVTAANAIYYYHKQGAGFASMIDGQNQDWIGYSTAAGSAGQFRGVPNLATYIDPDNVGVFHPGYTLSTSTVYRSGPIKITIRSVTNDDTWEKTWAIYPHYATMTLVRKPAGLKYWFLYEGTPGGAIDAGDFYYLADGTRRAIGTVLDGDLASEEWIYFGDDARTQVLYVISHQQDSAIDCHYVMDNAMTVFGFGRNRDNFRLKYLSALPGSFTIGFTDKGDFQAVSKRVRSAYQPLAVTVGTGELRP